MDEQTDMKDEQIDGQMNRQMKDEQIDGQMNRQMDR